MIKQKLMDVSSPASQCTHICLAVHFSHHEIQAAQDGDDIAHFVPTQHFRQDLQVDKGWPAQLCTPGILAAIADEVDTQFALAALNGKVGFTAWWTQGNWRADADGACGQLIDRHAAEPNTFANFLMRTGKNAKPDGKKLLEKGASLKLFNETSRFPSLV